MFKPLVGTQVNILPPVLYSKISETGVDFPAAAALSVVLMAVTVSVIAIAEILQTRRRTTARPKTAKP